MPLLSNIVLLRTIIVAVVLSCAESAWAQTNSTVRSPDEIVVTKLTDDANMIQFNPMVIDYLVNGRSSPNNHAIFQASFVKSSKAPFTSNFFTLWFHSTSRVCRYPSTRFVVHLRADNEVIDVLSNLRRAKSGEIASTFSEPENGCVESLWVHLHKDTFIKVANAQNVDVRLGILTFRLDAKHLRALRELAQQM